MLKKLPRIVGMNQLEDETSLTAEEVMFVREAKNVDIDRMGNVSRRRGASLLVSGSGYHSLYASQRSWLMLCYKNELGVFNTGASAFVPLVTMEDNYLTSFTETNGILYAMNPSFSCMFSKGSSIAKSIGVELPAIEAEFNVIANGAFEAGTYGIAYSIIDPDGEESPLSELVTLTLEENQGIQGTLFTVAAGYRYRVYMTTADGEVLRQAVEFDADTVSIQILNSEEGRRPETQGLVVLPKGHLIRAFNSRLLVADSNYVYFSESFRPHLAAPENYIMLSGFVTMMEPVKGGVFIGDQNGVRFYRGEDPSSWREQDGVPEPAIFNTSVKVSGKFFTGDLANVDEAIVWLSTTGYNIGLPTGEIIRPNSSQVRLPGYVQGCTTVSTYDGRNQVITPVNSNQLAASSTALDSSIL